MGWRLMPEVLRQPFLKQGATTKKFAFRSAMICGVVLRIITWWWHSTHSSSMEQERRKKLK